MSRLIQTDEPPAGYETSDFSCAGSSTTGGHAHDWQSANVHRRSQRLARVVVPVYGVHGFGETIEALRGAAVGEAHRSCSSEEHEASTITILNFAAAPLSKGSALVTLRNTEVNNGLEA